MKSKRLINDSQSENACEKECKNWYPHARPSIVVYLFEKETKCRTLHIVI